jgi:hypothetical protein
MTETRTVSLRAKLAVAAAVLAAGALWASISFAGGGGSGAPAAPSGSGGSGQTDSSWSWGTANGPNGRQGDDGRDCPFKDGQAPSEADLASL